MLRILAVIAVLLPLSALAEGRDKTIRDIQYTKYIREHTFPAKQIEQACDPNDGVGVAFRATSDQENLRTFLSFLQRSPETLNQYNGGQFADVAQGLRNAVENVCAGLLPKGGKAAGVPAFDPVIDVVNLSDFLFEYRFLHYHPQGHRPLRDRNSVVVEISANYDTDYFPDGDSVWWEHETTELVITVNNYDYYASEDAGPWSFPDKEYDSVPCYYIHPGLDAVYRYAVDDCNASTVDFVDPKGMSLQDAVKKLAMEYIEQMIDRAPRRTKVDIESVPDICCQDSEPHYGTDYFFAPAGECSLSGNSFFKNVPERFCKDPAIGNDDDENEDIDLPVPDETSGYICCRDYSRGRPFVYFKTTRRTCEDRDDHDITYPGLCTKGRDDGELLVCCEDGRGIIPDYFTTTTWECLERDRHRIYHEGTCI